MAKGKRSFFICERSGFKYPYSEHVVEPGTGLIVHKSETDGIWNRVDHPQNFSARPRPEGVGLKNASPDGGEGRDTFLLLEDGSPMVDEDGDPIYDEDNNIFVD